MEIEKLKKTANKLMWFGLLSQWILLFSLFRGGLEWELVWDSFYWYSHF